MIVGPVVEGHGEELVVPVLLEWLGVKHRPPFRAEGKQDLFERARDYAQAQLDKGADEVLFVFDADGPDGEAELELLTRRVAGLPVAGFVPVRMLEAWLLADESALAQVVGSPVARVPNPEDLWDPVAQLDSIFRAANLEGYRKKQHAKAIADLASDEHWRRRCPSYARGTGHYR